AAAEIPPAGAQRAIALHSCRAAPDERRSRPLPNRIRRRRERSTPVRQTPVPSPKASAVPRQQDAAEQSTWHRRLAHGWRVCRKNKMPAPQHPYLLSHSDKTVVATFRLRLRRRLKPAATAVTLDLLTLFPTLTSIENPAGGCLIYLTVWQRMPQ